MHDIERGQIPIVAIGKNQRGCRDSNRRQGHQLVALRAVSKKEQRGYRQKAVKSGQITCIFRRIFLALDSRELRGHWRRERSRPK